LKQIMKNGLYAWKVDGTDFPTKGSEAEKLRFLVNYAVLAPSKCNAQPWLFELCGSSLDLICDRNWAFRVTDPQSRELTLSCGAALLNLRLAAQHFGYMLLVETFPWPGDRYLVARVRLGAARGADRMPYSSRHAAKEPSDEELFGALRRRRTHPGSFWNGAPPDEVLARCCDAATQNGAWLHFVKDAATRQKVAALVAQADREQMAERSSRRELARWIHPARGRSKDGVSGSSYGLSGPFNLLTPGLPLLIKTLNLGTLIGAHHRELVERAPVLAVLGSTSDTPQAWLAAGQALELVFLQATVAGLTASFLNQPIEVEDLRSQLCRLVGGEGFPQVLLRLGYGSSTSHTPRRPAEEVVI
jgi:hypothetical protein